MIKQKATKAHYFGLTKEYITKEIGKDLDDITGMELLTHLIGDYDNHTGNSEYELFVYDPVKTTVLNRLNVLWVWPLFILTMPFRWLATGKTGFNHGSKIYKLIDRLINLSK